MSIETLVESFPMEGNVLLIGPMAAAKPLFGQMLAKRWVSSGGSLLYMLTSAPRKAVEANLRTFGFDDEELRNVCLVDYVPGSTLEQIDSRVWQAPLEDPDTLERVVTVVKSHGQGPWMVLIPSVTLLLANTPDRNRLIETLKRLFYGKSAVDLAALAVNTKMFQEENEMLIRDAERVLSFRRERDTVYLKVERGVPGWVGKEIVMPVPADILDGTKKEVAKRTSQLLRLKSEKAEGTMKSFGTGVPEIDKHLPEGIPYPSFTVVTGPGASGKPLFALYILQGWLESGGKAVYVATSTSPDFARQSVKLLGGDLTAFERAGQLGYVDFAKVEGIRDVSDNVIQVNLSRPEMLRRGLEEMATRLGTDMESALKLIPAVNLFFMFKGKREEFFDNLMDLIEQGTWLMTVNAEAFRKVADRLENRADNLIYTDMTPDNHIRARIVRAAVDFDGGEFVLPVSPDVLEAIKQEAEERRKQITSLK